MGGLALPLLSSRHNALLGAEQPSSLSSPPLPPPSNRSLSSKQAVARPPDLAAAMRSLRQQMLPRRIPARSAASAEQEQRQRAALIQHLLDPFGTAGAAPVLGSILPQAEAAPKVQVGAGAIAPAPQQQAAAAASKPTAAAADATAPSAKRVRKGEGAGEGGMQYFLQLQQRGGKSAAASGGAASSSSSGDSALAAEALEGALGGASTAVHAVELPPTHLHLLRLLREDEQRLVRGAAAPGVASEVARSDFLSVDVLQRALEQAAGRPLAGGWVCQLRGTQPSPPQMTHAAQLSLAWLNISPSAASATASAPAPVGQPAQRDLVKTYAAIAVVRQAAAALVHHGVRCAHLYLVQSQAELPGLLVSVTAAQELSSAYQQVWAGLGTVSEAATQCGSHRLSPAGSAPPVPCGLPASCCKTPERILPFYPPPSSL